MNDIFGELLMKLQNITIINRQGLKLASLLSRAERVCEGSGSRAPLVIVCHGFTGSKEGGGGATDMAMDLAGLGFDTLLFDFTGCGESEGAWEGITLSRQVDDLGAAVDWARAAGYGRIILNGRSFGGATALAYAAADPQIAALCTWAAVARPLRLFSSLAVTPVDLEAPSGETIVLGDDTGVLSLRLGFFHDLQRHDLPGCAARLAPRPLLLIHGDADELVPFSDAQLLFDSAGDPKKLALVEKADHRFTHHRRQVWDIFFDWLRQSTETATDQER